MTNPPPALLPRLLPPLRSLARHPNIVLFMGAGVSPTEMFLVTEYCRRGNLADIIDSGRPLSWCVGVCACV